MGDAQRLSTEMPAFRAPGPQCRMPVSPAPMCRMSPSPRNAPAGINPRQVAAVKKSVDTIVDTVQSLRKSATEVAVLYRASTSLRNRWLKAAAVVALLYKALEIATAPAKIVTELDNLTTNLGNFEHANLAQQEQVREALDRIADPLNALLGLVDETFGTRGAENHELAKCVLEVKDALRDLTRDLQRNDPVNVALDADKLKRSLEKLKEEVQKQLTAIGRKEGSGRDSNERREPRSALRPDDHAPTRKNPGKNYNRFAPYPITD
jgi:hypothetical protein